MKMGHVAQDVVVNGEFKTSDFNIGDIAFIVDMFADKVYSHKERAVIRELSCNAHDSHIMAGTEHIPFKVHLPTYLEKWFSIRDFGTGLSDHDIRTIFAGIGISTKRNSNDVIGCFGIGSLSPYSLSDSFTVTSYFNGVVRHYTCYRDDLRKPVVALLSEMDTDEPNGLEVRVSVKNNFTAFEEEAARVFAFWEGTIPDINNKDILMACEEYKKRFILTGDGYGFSNKYGSPYAIMGNIAYSIPPSCHNSLYAECYIKFDLGELDFDTSRENLSLTEKTKLAIKNKIETIKENLQRQAEQIVEGEDTAFKKAKKAFNLSSNQLADFVDLSKYSLPVQKGYIQCYSINKYTKKIHKYTQDYVELSDNTEYFLYHKGMDTRIKNYLKQHLTCSKILVFESDKQVNDYKIDLDIVKDTKDLPKVSSPRTSYSKPQSIKLFKAITNYSLGMLGWNEINIDLTNKKDILYVKIYRWNVTDSSYLHNNNNFIKAVDLLDNITGVKHEIVALNPYFLKSKIFKDNQDKFINFEDYLINQLKYYVENNNINGYLVQKHEHLSLLKEVNKLIYHEELDNLIESINIFNESAKMLNQVMDFCYACRLPITFEANNSLVDGISNFINKYEMLKILGVYDVKYADIANIDILARYINGEKRGIGT